MFKLFSQHEAFEIMRRYMKSLHYMTPDEIMHDPLPDGLHLKPIVFDPRLYMYVCAKDTTFSTSYSIKTLLPIQQKAIIKRARKEQEHNIKEDEARQLEEIKQRKKMLVN
jgi:hypothetical protein